MNKKTLGLVLGAGGARGAAHIGFIKALEEEGIKPDFITGCSMGSVVGSCYASGMSPDAMREAVLELTTFDLLDPQIGIIKNLGLLASKKLNSVLTRYLGNVTFDQLNIPFKCVASDILSNQLIEFSSGSVATAVQASSSIPGVFRPVEYDNKLLVDGGVLCRVPIKQMKAFNPDVIIAVDVLYNTSQPVKEVNDLIHLLLRVFDMMDNCSTSRAKELNKADCDLYLEPEMKGISQYVVKDLDKPVDAGYQLAKENMPKIKELLGL